VIDLGALIECALIATHPESAQMAITMLDFKEVFLAGFFLTITMTGESSLDALIIGLLLVSFALAKSAFVFRVFDSF
jgi:predicted Kef-type K+ transport protein